MNKRTTWKIALAYWSTFTFSAFLAFLFTTSILASVVLGIGTFSGFGLIVFYFNKLLE